MASCAALIRAVKESPPGATTSRSSAFDPPFAAFILATAFNRPQMQAVATKMRDHLNEKHGLSLAKNVTQQGDWVCVDCGEVVVHVFTPQSREFYDIEALYRDAVDVELPFETERPVEDEFEVF